MRLAWIEARDFRNHRETSLEVPPGLIAVVGPNGQGKTNLLEAMHYLCALESARVHSDLPLVRIGAPSAFVRGEILTEVGRFLVEVEVRPSGANRVQVNRSAVRRKRDLRARQSLHRANPARKHHPGPEEDQEVEDGIDDEDGAEAGPLGERAERVDPHHGRTGRGD